MKDQHGFNYALELSTTISNEALLFDITTKHETKTIFITGDVHFVKQSSSEAFKGPAGQNPKGYRRIARSSFKSYTGIAKNGIFFRHKEEIKNFERLNLNKNKPRKILCCRLMIEMVP